jgi:ribulose-5-phosphate 4-epimerase/fuculose-1-phosphate aldolase
MSELWKKAHIFGGGTFSHVRPHLALAAPAFGGTAQALYDMFRMDFKEEKCVLDKVIEPADYDTYMPVIHKTAMAGGGGSMSTNQDVSDRLDEVIADPRTKIIIMSAALCDFEPYLLQNLSPHEPQATMFGIGKDQERLKTAYLKDGLGILVKPSEKIIGRIRKVRKDIFLVGFKTTAGATEDEQFQAGLGLLKGSSCNMVLANDVHTRKNMLITPEEARYSVGEDRVQTLRELYLMVQARSRLNFTRSTVLQTAPLAQWDTDERIPDALRTVVNHCIKRGAYKPFQGKTVGHFAVKVAENSLLTSIRKTNFNNLSEVGLVLVEATPGSDDVLAYGAKPSVGGQSQRIIFREHPGFNCIVHFHCPLRNEVETMSTRSQKLLECGSHECGQNTSDGLKAYGGVDTDTIKAVMLDKHGPNIVFNHNIDPQRVIDFIETNWDLERTTSEMGEQ